MSEQSHIVSMTIDWTDGDPGVSVATCACGWSHREPRFGRPGEHDKATVEARRAAGERMDAAIAAHWSAEGVDQLKMGR